MRAKLAITSKGTKENILLIFFHPSILEEIILFSTIIRRKKGAFSLTG